MIRRAPRRVILAQFCCSTVGQQPLWTVIRYGCGISAASINHLLGIPGDGPKVL
jgi:hypothetical protein